MFNAGIKVGSIVKVKKEHIKTIHNLWTPNDKWTRRLYEVSDITSHSCSSTCQVIHLCKQQSKCSRLKFNTEEFRLNGCSNLMTLATDREAFLYHVAGLRERLE